MTMMMILVVMMMMMMMMMMTEGPKAAVPAGHDDPVVAGEHREPVASGHLASLDILNKCCKKKNKC